ncbi:MAG: hypothetical protein EXS16_04720 [Gemmataceae bacterium]|nr:hypothetical protein [Gemmataceae bacterium]
MNLWRAIIDFFASGQRRRGSPVNQSADVVEKEKQGNPPITSTITQTTHEAGITLDFPMREDSRPSARELAWRQFQIGLFLSLASVMIYAICKRFGIHDVAVYLGIPLIAGLIMLIAAAHAGSSVIRENSYDDDLQQLSVAGNLLVRTSRDLRKQVWYQHEIRDVLLLQSLEATHDESTEGATTPTVTYHFCLVVWLHNGEMVHLAASGGTHPLPHYRPHGELGWVATQLRLALFPTSSGPEPPSAGDPHANAIQAKDARREETRYTE